MQTVRGLLIILLCCIALPMVDAADFSAHGYFRTRYHGLFDLDAQRSGTAANNRFGLIQYNQMRLRVEPTLKINDHLSIQTQFDVLDNLAFGSANRKSLEVNDPIVGTITLPDGAGSLSLVGGQAGENGSINIRRAYMDILSPIGKFRLGRQPSHWGLGIIQNDGNGSDDDFGDTVDGVTYLVQKAFPNDGALTMGAIWDIAYESQRDPRIGGLAAALRDNGQDTNQWATIFLYERPEFDVGLLGVFRKRDGSNGTTTTATNLAGTSVAAGIDGNTKLYIIDLYGKYRINPEHWIALEYARVGGKISTGVALNAIAFPGLGGSGIIELPASQDVAVNLAALEAGGEYPWGGEWLLQGGWAEGDTSPLSQRITQYGFRPDYQIGFLLFHYPLGTSPTLRNGTTGAALTGGVPITGNFINNAYYGALTYKHKFDISRVFRQANEFKVGARVLTAFAHKNPVNLDFGALLSNATLPAITSKGKWYGVEGDILVEARMFDKLHANLETGVFVPGGAMDINVTLLDPGGIVATIPTDKAEIAFGARMGVSMEF